MTSADESQYLAELYRRHVDGTPLTREQLDHLFELARAGCLHLEATEQYRTETAAAWQRIPGAGR
jgi:Ser/Thr protein kinase RdoA (MazF antagonist)